MNRDDERTLRQWLQARDPGPARESLRAAARAVPFTERPLRFPALGLTLDSGFGLAPVARPLVIAALVIAGVAALAGALLLQPWRPFPPKGLLAYTAPLSVSGSTGITLVAADGTGRRQIGPSTANSFDHSPRWSSDGRTLLFARTTGLDPLASCGGIGSVVLYDVASGTERVVASGLRPMNVIEWSPDGERAAYTYPPPGCGAEVELGVVDLRTGQVSTTVVLPQESEFDPAQGVKWHVEWAGDTPIAVPDTVVTDDGGDVTWATDVRSHDAQLRVHWSATSRDLTPRLDVIDARTGAVTDLGLGGVPSWSPDDSSIAYIRPGGSAGPDAVDDPGGSLVLATAGTWDLRSLRDLLMPVPFDAPPRVSWTSDGSALYWLDSSGAHVIDVVTGRYTDLAAIPEGCSEIQWQPIGS